MEKLRLSQHSVRHKDMNYSDVSKEVAREFKEHSIECFASAPKLTSVIRHVAWTNLCSNIRRHVALKFATVCISQTSKYKELWHVSKRHDARLQRI